MFLSFLTALFCMSSHIGHVQCNPVVKGEKGDLEKMISIIGNYVKTNPETLEEIFNPYGAILEGDIMMPTDKNALEMTWPEVDGKLTVPYKIHADLAERTRTIMRAMELVSVRTCLSFHNRTTDEEDYLYFQPSRSCASYVGFRGGEQPLYVGAMCSVGNIAHELLHALGFNHEHTREDRDQYINIMENNIMTGREPSFGKMGGKTFGLPYDTTSIMHYGRFFFSKNGLPTIMAKGGDDKMGQRHLLTPLDVKRVRLLYKCDEREKDGKEAQSGSVVAHSSVFKQLLSALQLGKLRFDPSLD